MKRLIARFASPAIVLFTSLCIGHLADPPVSYAGWADTLPRHGMIIETSFISNVVQTRFNDKGENEPLAEIDMYAPTGEFLGTIVANAETLTQTLVNKIAVGVTDNLTLALIIPRTHHHLT